MKLYVREHKESDSKSVDNVVGRLIELLSIDVRRFQPRIDEQYTPRRPYLVPAPMQPTQ